MQPGIISLAADSMRKRWRNALEFYLFSISVFLKLFRLRRLQGIGKTVMLRQIMFTGYDALALIGFISLSTSALVILEVHQIMGQLGEGQLVYDLMVLIVIRQASSLFTALAVIARSGTSISTELGNMVVHKEIDLLNSFGISPFTYLVVPRVVGVVVSLFTLTLYFNLAAILGAAVFYSLFYDISIGYFINRLIRQLTPLELFIPVIKSILFGFAVGLLSCYQGLKVRVASTEVPQRTMRSVVNSVVWVLVLNIVVTLFEYI
jgi:phospholipid/cholesterol/gamma-HCH transport system permease protein